MNQLLSLHKLAFLVVDKQPITDIGTTPVATYDIRLVLLLIAIATIASYTALELAGQIKVTTGRWRLLWLSGGAIAHYALKWVALSIAIAFAASGVALWLAFYLPTESTLTATLGKVGSAILMGNAIAGMHYAGMAGVSFETTNSEIVPLSHVMDNSVLAVAIGGVTLLILIIGAIASLFDRRLSIEIARTEERQRVTAALEESEKRFRSMVGNIPGAVYRCAKDADWTMEFLSDVIEEISGFPASDFINNRVRTFASIIHPEDREIVQQIIEKSLEKRQPYIIEYRIVRADASLRWVYEKGQGFFDNSEGELLLDGVIVDITSRKIAEEKLYQSNQRIVNILDSLQEGFYAVNRQWQFTYINDRAKSFFYGKELLGKNIWQEFPGVVGSRLYHEYHKAVEQQIPILLEEYSSEDDKWFEVRAYPSHEGLSVYWRDITSRKQTETILKRYQLLSEHTRDIVLFIRPNGEIFEANHAALKLYGYDRQELLSLKVHDLRDPQTHVLLDEQMAQADTEGILYETLHRRKDGSTLPVEVSSQGAMIGHERILLNIVRDISDRQLAEKELRESEAAIRSLYQVTAARKLNFEHRLQGLLALGRRRFGLDMGFLGRLESVSKASPEKLRYEVVEAQIPKNVSFKMAKGDVLNLEQTYCHDVLTAQKPVCFESAGQSQWCTHPAYAVNKLEAYIGTPVIVSGQIHGALSFFSQKPRGKRFSSGEKQFLKLMAQWIGNELERLQGEEALKQSEERFRNLVETTSDWVWEIDENAVYTYTSPQVQEILGYKPEEVLGKTPLDFMPMKEAAEMADIFLRPAAPQQLLTCIERINLHKNGHVVVLESSGVPLLDGKGSFKGYRGIDRNITLRKQSEEKMRQALEKEKEIVQLRSQFISMASHDLRNPLTTILTSTDLLKSFGHKLNDEKRLKLHNKIQASVKVMTLLLDDVLFISKTDAGRTKFEPMYLNLEAFCRDILEDIQFNAKVSHSFVFEYRGDCASAEMDRNLLRRMLTNLLSNAVKYSPEGGTIQFEVTCDHKKAVFEIQDSGIGIPESDQERLFEAFHRASNVGSLPGTGLGMTIVKKAVDLHKGSITFKSSVGVGTSFIVSLPLRQFSE